MKWSRTVLEKLLVPQIAKFLAFYGAHRFVTGFIRACPFYQP